MHTGDLRPVYEKRTRVAYTWQVNFGGWAGSRRKHYTIDVEKLAEQQTVLAATNGRRVDKVKAFNLQVDTFAADISVSAEKVLVQLGVDQSRRERCVNDIYPTLRMQAITEPRAKARTPLCSCDCSCT